MPPVPGSSCAPSGIQVPPAAAQSEQVVKGDSVSHTPSPLPVPVPPIISKLSQFLYSFRFFHTYAFSFLNYL